MHSGVSTHVRFVTETLCAHVAFVRLFVRMESSVSLHVRFLSERRAAHVACEPFVFRVETLVSPKSSVADECRTAFGTFVQTVGSVNSHVRLNRRRTQKQLQIRHTRTGFPRCGFEDGLRVPT